MLVDQHAIVKAVANQAAAGAYYAKPVMATRDDLGSSTTAPYTGVLYSLCRGSGFSLGYRPSFSRTLRLASTAEQPLPPNARSLEAVLEGVIVGVARRGVGKPSGPGYPYYCRSPGPSICLIQSLSAINSGTTTGC